MFPDPPPGATPLHPDEQVGLRPTWIATRGELDRAEGQNILAATLWATRRRWSADRLLTVEALCGLHRRMFGDVWSWAGELRRHDTNIGVDPAWIRVATRDLCLDVLAQLADGSAGALPPDEVAVRFHHRLVSIHPFPNGNGRHARLASDLLVTTLGGPPFGWGRTGFGPPAQARLVYLEALRTADRHGYYEPLLAFARSSP